jgi:cytochrome b subunit of formate dehydrogenase
MENTQKVEKDSIIKQIQDFISDQDNNQKINVAISVALELYRVLVSSLLILFVPQDCDGHLCTLTENVETTSQIYTTGLFFNFATMFVFLMMYTLEVKRENRLITFLDVNKSMASDNDSVGQVLQKLPSEKRNSILTLDVYYQKVAYVAMGAFVINSIISGIVVYQYSLGNQTTTTIITNILFMVSKMSDVYLTVNTDKNVFYSAYLKGKIQYNDVDPDKIKLIELLTLNDIESQNLQTPLEEQIVVKEEQIVVKEEQIVVKEEEVVVKEEEEIVVEEDVVVDEPVEESK